MRVSDKTWVVTGAGNGIGRELTLQLLARGAQVAAVDLRAEALQETATLAAAGRALTLHALDVTDRDAVKALPQQVVAAHGAVDGLINNAGIMQPFLPVQTLPDDTIDRLIDVNLRAPITMIRAFLPHLRERPQAHICDVSSMGAFLPVSGQTIYGATKAGGKLLTEGLYAELRPTSVSVSVVLPGGVATSIAENSGVAMPSGADAASSKHPITPADVAARTILDGIERGRLHIYVGKDARFAGLLVRVAPKTAIRLVRTLMERMGTPPTEEPKHGGSHSATTATG